jgi:tripartite-type tricarboxylate transporter receptor subunit TctC
MGKKSYLHLAVLIASTALSADGLAQQYPAKPIRMVVAFAPGGGVDLIGRTIAQKLQEAWGQPVIVDNRPGAGGNVGTDVVAKAPPDGYTLLIGYVGNLSINPSLYRKLPYDSVKDFAPISLTATAPNLLVAHPAVTASTVRDLVALAKAKPGSLSYASAGNGTVGHMVAELFKSVTGVNIVHIPYKGNGIAVNDLLGGQVQLMFGAPAAMLTLVESTRLKAIAVTGQKRLPELRDTPTFAEAGFPKVEAYGWYGMLAPAGTPRAIVDALNKQVVRITSLPDVKDRLAMHGYTSISSTPGEFAQLIKSELAKWRDVVKASGATVD